MEEIKNGKENIGKINRSDFQVRRRGKRGRKRKKVEEQKVKKSSKNFVN
jgi:hypothetical protein